MRLLTLHDHLNPTREVVVNADAIQSIAPFGSGSSVQVEASIVGVHETPEEIAKLLASLE